MIDDSFSIERDVASALRQIGIYAVPGHNEDAELIAELTRQRDLYQTMALSLEASNLTANERLQRAQHTASILAVRCAEQAKELARLLTKYEPNGVRHDAEPHPIITAVAAMQRGGLR